MFISFYSLSFLGRVDPFVSMGFLTGVKQSENGRQLEAKFCLQAVIYLVSNCYFKPGPFTYFTLYANAMESCHSCKTFTIKNKRQKNYKYVHCSSKTFFVLVHQIKHLILKLRILIFFQKATNLFLDKNVMLAFFGLF